MTITTDREPVKLSAPNFSKMVQVYRKSVGEMLNTPVNFPLNFVVREFWADYCRLVLDNPEHKSIIDDNNLEALHTHAFKRKEIITTI